MNCGPLSEMIRASLGVKFLGAPNLPRVASSSTPADPSWALLLDPGSGTMSGAGEGIGRGPWIAAGGLLVGLGCWRDSFPREALEAPVIRASLWFRMARAGVHQRAGIARASPWMEKIVFGAQPRT